jgi:hypothetical protein
MKMGLLKSGNVQAVVLTAAATGLGILVGNVLTSKFGGNNG